MKQYGWGILGAGVIARKMADALNRHERSKLTAVGSRDPRRAESFAETYHIPSWGDHEMVVTHPGVDVVYVANTHNFHEQTVRLALEHGKHVLVEKPFTVNASQADQLISLAREKKLFLMEAMWTRWLPLWKTMKERISRGDIGDIAQINVVFGKVIEPEYRHRLENPNLAGGVTLDMGIYPLSFCSYLTGSLPQHVRSLAKMTSLGVDEQVSCSLEYPGGTMAQITAGFEVHMERRAVIMGKRGYIVFPDFPTGDYFSIYSHGGTGTIEQEQGISVDHEPNGFIYQVEEVASCLDRGALESSVMGLDETRGLMEVMDTMRSQWNLVYPFE